MPGRGRLNTVLLLCALAFGALILVQAANAPAPPPPKAHDSPAGTDAFGIQSNAIAQERRRIRSDPGTANASIPTSDLRPTGPLSDLSQRGMTLGFPSAYSTLTVYANLASPEAGHFVRDALPLLVASYVRRGYLQLRLHTIAGPGDTCSVAAQPTTACTFAETAQAVSFENKMWTFLAVVNEKRLSATATTSSQTTIRNALTKLGIPPTRITTAARTAGALDAVATDMRSAKRLGLAGPLAFVLDPPGVRTPPAKLPGPLTTTQLLAQVYQAVSLPGG
jgi:hypothetical protein